MKHLSLFFFLLVLTILSRGQAIITKPTSKASLKSITDFGAKPNDGIDDTWAFIKAGKYFSNLWDINGVPLRKGMVNFDYSKFSAQLNIPAGTFNIGKLINVPPDGINTTYGAVFGYLKATEPLIIPAGAAYKYGLELFVLQNAANNINEFVMQGQGKSKSKIKYNDHLVTGYFDSKGSPLFFPKNIYDNKYVVSAGHFFFTVGTKNIILQNFEVDGNNADKSKGGTMYYDGGWDSHLIQMGAVAANIKNTQNVTLSEVNFHHMALDGIIFQDYYNDPSLNPARVFSNLLIKNSNFNHNRRQGFSWIGGRKVTVVNSTFNNTGTTVSGKGGGNPAAGLDIEPEGDAFGNTTWCMDGKFTNCEFVNNVGLALGNDYPDFSKNMIFENCKFHDVTGYAVWIRGKQYRFNNCKIWGGFLYGNPGLDPADATVFNNCDFADEEIPGQPGIYNKGFDLIGSWEYARRMRFNDCTFRTIHPGQKLATIYAPATTESEFNIFSNCKFMIGPKSNGNNIFFGCIFDGNNSFINNNTAQTEVININGVVFTGSNSVCKPNEFIIKGKIMFHPANTHGKGLTQFMIGRNGIGSDRTDGFINFTIGPGSGFYSYWNQQIDIGKNATFINASGGQLAMLSGTINNSGTIILDKDSYAWFGSPVAVNTSKKDNTEFYFNKNAQIGLNEKWASILTGFDTKGIDIAKVLWSNNTIIEGGNVKVPGKFRAPATGELNGINQYVSMQNPSEESKLSNYGSGKNFSIEIKFKRAGISRTETLFSQGEFNIFFKGSQLYYSLPGQKTPIATGIVMQAENEVTHLLTFVKGVTGYLQIYLDSKLRHTSSKKITGNISSKNNIFLGRQSEPGSKNYFKGEILQARIWNRELSREEICYNLNRKSPLNAASIVAYWGIENTANRSADLPIAGKLVNEASK